MTSGESIAANWMYGNEISTEATSTPSKDAAETIEPYTPSSFERPSGSTLQSSVPITEVIDDSTPIRPGAKPRTPEAYSPGRPGIKIVKRKPAPIYDLDYQNSKRLCQGPVKTAEYLLSLTPSKSILRKPCLKKEKLFVKFSDINGKPLVSIKEIPSCKSNNIHHSNEDLRNFEARQERFVSKFEADVVDWVLIEVDTPNRRVGRGKTESGLIEEKRIKDLGILTGAVFGSQDTIEPPEIHELSRPNPRHVTVTIPLEAHIRQSADLIMALPLPGRHDNNKVVNEQDQSVGYQPTQQKQQQYQQIFDDTPQSNSYAQEGYQYSQVPTYSQEAYNGYVASTIPAVKSEEAPKSTSSLPANLKAMLDQLKTKGFVSSDEQRQPVITQPDNDYAYQASFSGVPVLQEGPAYPIPPNQQGDPALMQNGSWTQSSWKIQEACTYFVYRAGGCVRGDNCRFLHDEEMKQALLRERAERRGDQNNQASHQIPLQNGGRYHNNGPHGQNGPGFRGGMDRGGGGFRGAMNRGGGGFRGGMDRGGGGFRGSYDRGGRGRYAGDRRDGRDDRYRDRDRFDDRKDRRDRYEDRERHQRREDRDRSEPRESEPRSPMEKKET